MIKSGLLYASRAARFYSLAIKNLERKNKKEEVRSGFFLPILYLVEYIDFLSDL